MIVYVSAGNSDNKLTQQEWSEFVNDIDDALTGYGDVTHGKWFSHSDSAYQNACFCVEFETPRYVNRATARLRELAWIYQQDAVVWAEAHTTMLTPQEPKAD